MEKLSTQQKLIGAARVLFLSRGYTGTTVDDICAMAHVSKGNFYHYFKNKEQLGVATLKDFHHGNGSVLMTGPFQSETNPKKRALKFIDHVESSAKHLWGDGCLLGNFALELGETSPRVHAEVGVLFDEVAQGMAKILAPLAAQGKKGPSAKELAESFIAMLEGSIVLARAHNDWRRIISGVRGFRRSVAGAAA